MAEKIEFVVNGKTLSLSRAQVLDSVAGLEAEPIRSHSVVIGGTHYPVKQVFERATGLDRLDFTSAVARRQLLRLGFKPQRQRQT